MCWSLPSAAFDPEISWSAIGSAIRTLQRSGIRGVHMAVYMYSWLSLSRPRLSRITAYLEVKIWSLPIHENLTSGAISPLFHNIFNIFLTSKVQLPISLLNVINQIIFSSILQTWYVELRISRSISESPLEFEITRVDCMYWYAADVC